MNDNGNRPVKINLVEAIKKTLEEVVERGSIENEEEQGLISDTALLYRFLTEKNGPYNRYNRKIRRQVEERKKETGHFFPLITEVIFLWRKEGNEGILEEITELAEKI